MKKILLIALAISLVVSLSKASLSSAEEINPGDLTLADLNVPGATEDYLEAYRLFLKAHVTDKEEYTHSRAIEALREVSQTTKSLEVKLRCLLLIPFSYFSDGKTKEAYKASLEVLSLVRTYLKDDPKIVLLDKIESAIDEGKEITGIPGIISLVNHLGEEVTELIKYLFHLRKGMVDFQEKLSLAFDERIASLAMEHDILSPKEVEKIKKEFEERYSRRVSSLHFGYEVLEAAFREAVRFKRERGLLDSLLPQ